MRALLAAVFAVALAMMAGCASPTRLNAQWLNPQFDGKPAPGKVLVMSSTPDGTTRRVFEDLMVKALEARGVAAVPSYRFVPADGPASQEQIEAAVKASGAQTLLASRLIGATQILRVAPGAGWGPGWGGPWGGPWWGWGGAFYGPYGGMWGGGFAAPQVWTDESVLVDTQFVDAAAQRVVWSGSTTTTTAPGSQGTVPVLQQFVHVIVDAIAAAKLI